MLYTLVFPLLSKKCLVITIKSSIKFNTHKYCFKQTKIKFTIKVFTNTNITSNKNSTPTNKYKYSFNWFTKTNKLARYHLFLQQLKIKLTAFKTNWYVNKTL